MRTSGLTSIADTILTNLAGATAQAVTGRSYLASLFLPADLGDATARLSPADLVATLRGARDNLMGLSSASERLDLANPTSVFFFGTGSSSDSAAIDVRAYAGVSTDTQPTQQTYTFTVSQVAQAQANVGTALTSSTVSGFTAGTNTVRVTQNGTTTDVSFTVGAGETNATVLDNFAAAVNATTNLGVSASVNTDAMAGTSQLVIQSRYTGTTYGFTLTNVAGAPVTNAGVGTATTAAANASYTQNGVALSGSSNELFLGSTAGLKVTLRTTTSSAITVTVGPDTAQIGSAIATLVSAYNAARGFFDERTDTYPAVSNHLVSVVSRLSAQLRNIGIEVGSGGLLSTDSDRLDAALTRALATVQRALGDSGGLARETRTIADTFLSQPAALTNPLPPFQETYGPRQLAADFAGRLNTLRTAGLLVSALA